MTTRETIKRYHLIINKLRKGPASFKEIRNYLKDESILQEYDFNISARTFKRDCEDISSIYGIEIVYDFSKKVYKIESEEKDEATKRIMESFDLIDSFGLSKNISEQVYFEKRRSQGTENLYGLLYAIKKQEMISFTYYNYWEDKTSNHLSEPYALKEFKSRWYILAKDSKTNQVKPFALDRLSELDFINKHFEIPEKFNANYLYRHCFGIFLPNEDQKVEKVILSFSAFQGRYIRSLPFHRSQEILIDSDKELRIKLWIYITHDFIMEILSYGENIRVISPTSLIDELKRNYKNGLKQYDEVKELLKVKVIDLKNLNELLGKEICFHAQVTNVKKSKTKNGKPFGILTISDNTGDYTLCFFGKEFKTFEPLLNPDIKLEFIAFVRNRSWGEKEEYLQLISMSSDNISLKIEDEKYEEEFE